jgi:signal transduction histidine kinase
VRRRILTAIVAVTAIAILLFGLPLAVAVRSFVDEDAALRVERRAVLATREVPSDFAGAADPVELPANTDGITLALYDESGRLVAGNGPAQADAATLRALKNEVVDAEAPGVRVVAVPVAANEVVIGAIRAEQSTAASSARSRRILLLLGGLAVLVLGVAAAIGHVVAGRLARPVRRLGDAAVQLGDGDFALDVPRSRVPELDQAAQAMMSTARRLDDLLTRERAFSSDTSHQLRTPLAGLRAAIETELEFPRTDRTAVLHEAVSDIDRLEQTITELLSIARSSTPAPSSVSIADVLAELEIGWSRRLAKQGRSLTVSGARFVPAVRGNRAALRHGLDVLIENALVHGAGEIRIEHAFTQDTVTISVSDEGPGFSTQEPTPGHGLGLPLARRLIESMPGRLTTVRAESQPRIDILLQRAEPEPD